MTTSAERAYLGRVASLGCALCRRLGLGATPAQVHHRRTGTGAAKRAPHSETAPLCEFHHTSAAGIHGLGRKAFEREYGVTELELIAETKRLAGWEP